MKNCRLSIIFTGCKPLLQQIFGLQNAFVFAVPFAIDLCYERWNVQIVGEWAFHIVEAPLLSFVIFSAARKFCLICAYSIHCGWLFLEASDPMADLSEEQLSVKYEEEFILNSRGLKLFTCRWLPATREPKALVCLCHGYGMECSVYMHDTGVRLAKAGYAVFGIDYEGHGKSAGMRCYIQRFQDLVDDCTDFFKSVGEGHEYKNRARFLYGESMGGAVALLIHRQQPAYWNGAVLVAPMCKIADDLKPHPLVIRILNKLTGIIPTWKIVPTQDIVNVGFKDPQKREEIRANPYIYRGKPRLKTGYEILMASMDIEKRLDEVTLPFLILHGEADVVTDPAVSKLLYDSAKSIDKSIKLYPDMWHGLTCGEPPDNTQLVFTDITAWLDKRSSEMKDNLERNC